MRLDVLGGCGAWPTARQGCSGYVVDSGGFRLLIDPGYATLPRLWEREGGVDGIDAVLVSHGHPDHCADLNPLLRARDLSDEPPEALGVYAPVGAVDAVLALDKPGMLADAYDLHEFGPGQRFEIGPFRVDTWLLPHFVPNAGVRLSAEGAVLAYTGDTGPSEDVPRLAREADVLLSEATYPYEVPRADADFLLTAHLAGGYATRAGAGHLVLTHLWPGTDRDVALEAGAASFGGTLSVAEPGLVVPAG
ncbi:MBL fold metallo-hydrolase [Streptomyces iconiensis]|uniref:MBL fold metallo-hydrolase n=1 Tax=Streptomyces iconiensis TaxID=1384038 RepID=A0ABT7A0M5_9ACTN|nr:MBL fold metallo-hydrolase [Streptomyces iconiensis]MDJ1134883.1 MBL fold metallo-hydrolase [Streptomyces iconiensis]